MGACFGQKGYIILRALRNCNHSKAARSDRDFGSNVTPFLEESAESFIISKSEVVDVLVRDIHTAEPAERTVLD
jgi:hypothetical protein